jgi:hypothetical protein
MHCYVCEHSEGISGTRYAIREAAGICHHCGIGVCEKHAHKSEEPGAPLFCEECAGLANEPDETSRKAQFTTA